MWEEGGIKRSQYGFTLPSKWGCDRRLGLWQRGSEDSHDFFLKMEEHGLADNLLKTEFYVAEELHGT